MDTTAQKQIYQKVPVAAVLRVQVRGLTERRNKLIVRRIGGQELAWRQNMKGFERE